MTMYPPSFPENMWETLVLFGSPNKARLEYLNMLVVYILHYSCLTRTKKKDNKRIKQTRTNKKSEHANRTKISVRISQEEVSII